MLASALLFTTTIFCFLVDLKYEQLGRGIARGRYVAGEGNFWVSHLLLGIGWVGLDFQGSTVFTVSSYGVTIAYSDTFLSSQE